jgi:hypothetical protein
MSTPDRSSQGGLHEKLLPQTGLGWWTVALAFAVWLFLLVVYSALFAGLETRNLAVVILLGLSIACGLAATILGVVSVNVRKDRSILVFVAAALSLIYVCSWLPAIPY